MEVLQKCPLFSGFGGEEISILLGRAQPLRCKMKKGEKVPAGHLGLLLSGRLCIKGQAADSRSIQLNHVLPGAAFGAAALFLEGAALSDTYAEIASEVLLLNAEQVWAMMDESPLFRKNYLIFLCGRIAFLNQKIETLSGYTAESRLLAYLRQKQQGGVLRIRNFSALAGVLGISRASLYRALDVLADSGQIARQGGCILVQGQGGEGQ